MAAQCQAKAPLAEAAPPEAVGRCRDLFAGALRHAGRHADPAYCRSAKRVILIAGASRSGSSWLAEILRSAGGLYSLAGEVDPFLQLAMPGGRRDDVLDAADLCGRTAEELGLLLSWSAERPKLDQRDWYLSPWLAYSTALRLRLQWPAAAIADEWLLGAIRDGFGSLRRRRAADEALLDLLFRLKAYDRRINPYYYDLDPAKIREWFPGEQVPEGPPSPDGVLEEPPFVPFRPAVPADPGNRTGTPLLLKSPSNSYRLGFFRALFPNAAITLVHIVRRPAASIRGLMCGWRHHGFYKYRLRGSPLRIRGYSEPERPWTAEWWKFDLPPGWEECAQGGLAEVCSNQWRSANRHVLDWMRRAAEVDYVQVRYEALLANPCAAAFALCRRVGVEPAAGVLGAVRSGRRVMRSSGVNQQARVEMGRLAADEASRLSVREMEKELDDAKASFETGPLWKGEPQ